MELSGGDLKQRYRILNELYKVNQLPTFVIPEDMFPACSSQPEASNITISSTPLADILSPDAHPVQPATDSAISLHTATPDEPSTSPVVLETTPASPETTPAAPEITPASQVPTPDASANQHLSSDDDSTASIDVKAQSPSPATEESPRVSALYDQREKITHGSPEYRRLSSKILNTRYAECLLNDPDSKLRRVQTSNDYSKQEKMEERRNTKLKKKKTPPEDRLFPP
nr:merozoite surface protein CMZ-8-like [Procambarus clarkii]